MRSEGRHRKQASELAVALLCTVLLQHCAYQGTAGELSSLRLIPDCRSPIPAPTAPGMVNVTNTRRDHDMKLAAWGQITEHPGCPMG
jgi:hypothetical protein